MSTVEEPTQPPPLKIPSWLAYVAGALSAMAVTHLFTNSWSGWLANLGEAICLEAHAHTERWAVRDSFFGYCWECGAEEGHGLEDDLVAMLAGAVRSSDGWWSWPWPSKP